MTGTDSARLESYAAPDLDAWDQWNYSRTDHLLDPMSARYVRPGWTWVDDAPWGWAPYHYGRWRT